MVGYIWTISLIRRSSHRLFLDENSNVLAGYQRPYAATISAIPEAHSSVPTTAAPATTTAAATTSMITNPSFKSSPFYSPVQRLAGPVICPIGKRGGLCRQVLCGIYWPLVISFTHMLSEDAGFHFEQCPTKWLWNTGLLCGSNGHSSVSTRIPSSLGIAYKR